MNVNRVTLQHNKEFIVFIFFNCFISMCKLKKRLIRATFLSTPASDGHER